MVVELEYPLAPHDLFAVLVDRQYLAARHERFGGVGTPEVFDDGGTVQLRIGRQLPMDKIPSAARGLVGDGRLVQVDVWDTRSLPLRGEWHAEVDHAPVVLGGDNEIAVSDLGSRYSIGVQVKVKVPLIGRQLEGQVRGYLETLVARSYEAYRAAG